MSFISIKLYHKVARQAMSEGMSAGDFEPLGVSLKAEEAPQVVPAESFFELHELVDRSLPAGFSVRVGRAMEMDDYGVLGLSWKTCMKARDLFDRSVRYFHLLTNTYVFKVEDEQDVSKIYLLRDPQRWGVALSNESTFAATVKVLQLITEKDPIPVAVSFKHDPPLETSVHEAHFRCPIHFNQAFNYIAYRTSDLEIPSTKADRSLNQFLEERLEEEAKGIEVNADKVVNDVQKLIKDALPSGIPSVHQIGEHLGMSSRTLTRRLSESGLSFRDLIKQTQEELSIHLLRHTTRSIGEIAFQAGFSEQSAFNRAFKRWTGQAPVAFRKS